MKTLIAISLALVFSGCTTTAYWTQKRYNPKGGVVGYRTTGLGFNVEKRVIDADNKMAEFCAPLKPVVQSENEETKNAGTQIMSNGFGGLSAIPVNEEYRAIDFTCESRTPASR